MCSGKIKQSLNVLKKICSRKVRRRSYVKLKLTPGANVEIVLVAVEP